MSDAVRAQRGDHARPGAGQRGAQLQRPLDRVGGGLEPVDLHGIRGVDGRIGGRWCPPARRAAARPAPRCASPATAAARGRGRAAGGRRGEQVVRPGQREVTEQQRHREPVLLGVARGPVIGVLLGDGDVHARPAAPGVRAVDHVVVQQGAGLDQLEGAAIRTTGAQSAGSARPPPARQPHHRNSGRSRLPPATKLDEPVDGRPGVGRWRATSARRAATRRRRPPSRRRCSAPELTAGRGTPGQSARVGPIVSPSW